ncbi:MAG: mandelate racemase/muconate lactonizing enzyme family protein [Hyphomicrobiaceae bacterium]
MRKIERLTLRRLALPLVRPYRLSYRTFHVFEPFVVEIETDDGAQAFGDGHISPGSSEETREAGWSFLTRHLAELPGRSVATARARMLACLGDSKVAATACLTAIDVLEAHPMLDIHDDVTLPLLTPIGATEHAEIVDEVESALSAGFKTLKVKVGKDLEADLKRLSWIQEATGGQAVLRVDANRAYSRGDAIAFATLADPTGIELFEQPCDAGDWDANAAVAAASRLPIMLDEPICALADIARAATIPGVAFCKVKLKRFGNIDNLVAAIDHITANGMVAVLGDGLGSEIHSWLEACVAAQRIDNAGEFNGFLKPHQRLLENELKVINGAIHLPKGFAGKVDRGKLDAVTEDIVKFH